jgi:hypothetical protein
MTFSKKLPRVSDGFGFLMWRVISSAQNLIKVVQTVRRKLRTSLINICTILTLTGIELGTPKSQHSICDVNVFTLTNSYPTYISYRNMAIFNCTLLSSIFTCKLFFFLDVKFICSKINYKIN